MFHGVTVSVFTVVNQIFATAQVAHLLVVACKGSVLTPEPLADL